MKQMQKKLLALLLAAAMLFSLAACGAGSTDAETDSPESSPSAAAEEAPPEESAPEPEPSAGPYTDGSLEGSAYGMNGDVPVTVVVENGNIVSVTVGENAETAGIGTAAIEQVPPAIVEAQSTDVDTVSGATITSQAIIQAANIALGLAESESPSASNVTEADVIVVGAGLAGLVSAARAAELGASVILMEQSGAVGGSSRYAGGYVSGAKTELQAAAGIEDSYELAFEDLITIGGSENLNHDLAWAHVQRAGEMVNWITDDLGVALSEPGFGAYTPTNVARVYQTAGGGVEYSEALYAKKIEPYIEEGLITLLLNTEATELVTGESGAISGVVANGVTYSADAVILATGGYGYNEEWVARYNFAHSRSQSPVTAIGSGYDLAESVGATFSNMEYLPAYPGAVDTNEDSYSTTVIANTSGWSGAIWVDLNGKRLADEVGFTTAARQAAWEDADENYVYIVFTQEMMDQAEVPLFDVDASAENWDRFNAELEEGYSVFSAASIEELAAAAGIDAAGLASTIEAYNGYVEAGKDAEFGRSENLMPFDSSAYYAVRTVPYILLTKGGVDIDTSAAVLREDGSAIEGLYACGELIGGANLGGFGSHGGLAHAICFVWGTVAAESAASLSQGAEVHVSSYEGISDTPPA